ncbi:MAG: TerC family protein [Phycisphaeraceae bacterium]|nr:TerC family protein [Phycisphaeraceae bacterium]
MNDLVSGFAAVTLPAASHPGVVWLYVGFIAMVLVFLALDLGVFHRHAHEVKVKEAITWTIVWVVCAMLFNVGVYFIYEHHVLGIGRDVQQLGAAARDVGGAEAAKLFFTGYIVEKSLSMDNVFVIAMIFTYFGVPAKYQHRVLFWGIIGALLMRGLMIGIGAALISRFSWVVYIFGGFLILSALKMAVIKSENVDPNNNPAVKLVRRMIPVTPHYDGQKFFTNWNGHRAATPLFLTLVLVEFTDLIFAVDSIPAIFAITADPFIVFTSNVFAILGLRALYFCLANMISAFRYLKPALILVLAFVGVKMLLVHTEFKIPNSVSLAVIISLLGIAVLASWLIPAKPGEEHELPGPEGILDPAAAFRRKPKDTPAPASTNAPDSSTS